jgi:hypothetical protein
MRNIGSTLFLCTLLAVAVAPEAGAGYCPTPHFEDTYVLDDGTLVDVYVQNPGFHGESCMPGGVVPNSSGRRAGGSGRGNSAGTRSFVSVGTAAQQVAVATVEFVDGSRMRMNGPPRITNGRFAFTNDLGQLVQLPLTEVRGTDSARHYRCDGCARDASGNPVPALAIRNEFVASHPCPGESSADACPGFVVDHVTPLACGGEDAPHNLQWQTFEQATKKREWVARACR